MRKTTTLAEYNEKYIKPLQSMADLGISSDELVMTSDGDVDGLDGFALDALLALADINGEEATDGECLVLAETVVRDWARISSHIIEWRNIVPVSEGSR
jgi:hypothetical protein